MKSTILLLITLFFITEITLSQTTTGNDPLIVGTRVAPPFVIEDENGVFTGLSVELLNYLSNELGFDYEFVETDIQGMLDGVANGRFDVSISALTITSEREALVDFTHPFFVAGYGIATSYRPVGIWQAFLAVFSFEFLWVTFLLIAILFFWGFLVWLFERKNNTDEFGGSTTQGIGSGFWWAAVTMTTVGYGDKSPRTLGGRIVGFVWMFAAIILISFFTASIASSLTVSQLDSRVSGPQDLPFVRTGALENSATLHYFNQERIRVTTFSSIEDGLMAVKNNDIDAFVHDAPILQYFTASSFRNQIQVLPNTFLDQYYGIALPLNSDLRNDINRIMLDFINSDEWSATQDRYLRQ